MYICIMGKTKIDKASAIKLILKKKKEGISDITILDHFRQKYNFSKASYYLWKSEAVIQFKEFEAKVNPIIEAKEIEAIGEMAKAGILSKIERQKILTELATGQLLSWKEIPTKHGIERVEFMTASDIVKAIAELNKMDGFYIREAPKDTTHEFEGFEIQDV